MTGALVLVALCALVIICSVTAAQWRLADASVQALLVVGVVCVLRPGLLIAGLDTPFPDEVFGTAVNPSLLARTQLQVLIWLIVFVAVTWLFRTDRPARQRSIVSPKDSTCGMVAVALGAVGLCLAIPLWVRYGGPIGLARAAKAREVDSYRARVPAQLAAYLGIAALVAGRRIGSKSIMVQGFSAYIAGAAVSYTWGARDAAIFPLALLVLMPVGLPRRLTLSAASRMLRAAPRVAVVVAAMLVVGVGLRLQRDQALIGRVSSAIEDRSLARRTSVAMNLTQFDAFMLVMRDENTFPSPGFPALGSSLQAVVPSSLRDVGTSRQTPGVIVAQRYVEGRKNGWPLSAPGDWFFILRTPGVILGAAVSAAAAAVLGRWALDQSEGRAAATHAVVWMWGSAVAPGGIWMNTPVRAISVMVPVLAVLTFARLFDSTDDQESPETSTRDAAVETWPYRSALCVSTADTSEHA